MPKTVFEVAENNDLPKSKSQDEVTASYKSADKFSSDEYEEVQQDSQPAEYRNALAASVRPQKVNVSNNIVEEIQQVICVETGQAAISTSLRLDPALKGNHKILLVFLSHWKASKSLSATQEQSVVLSKELRQDHKSESLMPKKSKLLSTNGQQSSLTRDVLQAEIRPSGTHNKDPFLPEKISDSNSTASDGVGVRQRVRFTKPAASFQLQYFNS